MPRAASSHCQRGWLARRLATAKRAVDQGRVVLGDVIGVEAAAIEGFVLKNRLVFNGRAGDGTFIVTVQLLEPLTETLRLYRSRRVSTTLAETGRSPASARMGSPGMANTRA